GTHNRILSASPAYETNWLGRYFLPTNSVLLDHGSRTADQAGLYWFSATCNPQLFETNSTVDIGWHGGAVDGSGSVLDQDIDGIPTLVEDTNGNGVSDGNEQSFINPAIQFSSTNMCAPLNSPTNNPASLLDIVATMSNDDS